MQKYITDFIVFIVVFVAAAGGGYWKGCADTREKNLAADIKSLQVSISDFNHENKEAAKLNLQFSKNINATKTANAESTKVFTHALAATAHLRFNCVFGDSIMQQLDQAADLADKAASSGIVGAMRTGDPPTR